MSGSTYNYLGIELMAAAQALDFREHSLGLGVSTAKKEIRKHVDFLDVDRPLHSDHTAMKKLVSSLFIMKAVEDKIGNIYKK